MTSRILIINDNSDVRSNSLLASFRKRGAHAISAPLAALAFDTSGPHGLSIPGFDEVLPDAVLVRSIAAGSFEAITRRLGILHALAKLSVPVWNSAQSDRTLRRQVDDDISDAACGTADTGNLRRRREGRGAEHRRPRAPAFSASAEAAFRCARPRHTLIRELADLPPEEDVNGVYYLQHYVPRTGPPFRDFRVFVCAGEAVAMMSRCGDDWVTNVNRGAMPEQFAGYGQAQLGELAVAAAAVVGADFAGVDLVQSVDGRLLVLEVNSMPAWSGLQSVTDVDVADAIAAALLACVGETPEGNHIVDSPRLRVGQIRDMRMLRETIRAAYLAACRQELEALKPGNVHLFADGHRMSADHFLNSAEISSIPLTDPELTVGRRILNAVRVTKEAVGMNTNLGIILLCAPLACAAQLDARELRENLEAVLRSMTMDDAGAVFEAIVLASPGGLGSASAHDVRNAPTVPLLQAMQEASDRDMVARQYVTSYEDIFQTGLVAHSEAIARGERGMWPAVFTYMSFLTAFPDSHVHRKFGPGMAAVVLEEARAVQALLGTATDEPDRLRLLAKFDRSLKARGINPGTSADLTVACLLVHNVRSELA